MHGWKRAILALLMVLVVGLGTSGPVLATGDDGPTDDEGCVVLESCSNRWLPDDEGDPDDYDLVPDAMPPDGLAAREEMQLVLTIVASVLNLSRM